MTPKLSVIMSAYNSSETIGRAMNSILNQSFSDFELVVLNDGSTDDTESKILSFDDDRIRYHRLDHAGLTKALNFGISEAQGAIIVRHDSDDWSESDRFAKQVEVLDGNPDVSLVSSWHNVVDVEGNYLGKKPTADNDVSLKRMLRRRNPFCHGTVAVRKSVLEAVGGYNEELLFSQDYDLWLRLAAAGYVFACIPEPLYNYSISPDSIAKGWLKLAYASDIRDSVANPDGQQGFSVSGIAAVSDRRTNSLWNYALGSLALDDGRRGRALGYFAKSLVGNPIQSHGYMKLGAALLPAGIARFLARRIKAGMESNDKR